MPGLIRPLSVNPFVSQQRGDNMWMNYTSPGVTDTTWQQAPPWVSTQASPWIAAAAPPRDPVEQDHNRVSQIGQIRASVIRGRRGDSPEQDIEMRGVASQPPTDYSEQYFC